MKFPPKIFDRPLERGVERLAAYDRRRSGFTGEHWLVLGAGIVVFLASRRSRSPLWRAVGPTIGSSLLYRAASGREGLARLLRFLPIGRSGPR